MYNRVNVYKGAVEYQLSLHKYDPFFLFINDLIESNLQYNLISCIKKVFRKLSF